MLPSPELQYNERPLANEAKGNQLFPVFIKLNQLRTLLVGGGKVGIEKLNAILNNSQLANVTVIAETIAPEIEQLKKTYPHLKLKQRSFEAASISHRYCFRGHK